MDTPRRPYVRQPEGATAALGTYLRDCRQAAKLTQEVLGLMLGVRQATVCRWERGRRGNVTLPLLRAWAKALPDFDMDKALRLTTTQEATT